VVRGGRPGNKIIIKKNIMKFMILTRNAFSRPILWHCPINLARLIYKKSLQATRKTKKRHDGKVQYENVKVIVPVHENRAAIQTNI